MSSVFQSGPVLCLVTACRLSLLLRRLSYVSRVARPCHSCLPHLHYLVRFAPLSSFATQIILPHVHSSFVHNSLVRSRPSPKSWPVWHLIFFFFFYWDFGAGAIDNNWGFLLFFFCLLLFWRDSFPSLFSHHRDCLHSWVAFLRRELIWAFCACLISSPSFDYFLVFSSLSPFSLLLSLSLSLPFLPFFLFSFSFQLLFYYHPTFRFAYNLPTERLTRLSKLLCSR